MSIKDLRKTANEIYDSLSKLHAEANNLQGELMKFQSTIDFKNENKMKVQEALSICSKIRNQLEVSQESLQTLKQSPPGFASAILDFTYQLITDKNIATEQELYREKLKNLDKAIVRQSITMIARSFGLQQESFIGIAKEIAEKFELPQSYKIVLAGELESVIAGIFREIRPDELGGNIEDSARVISRILEEQFEDGNQAFEKLNKELYKLISDRVEKSSQPKVLLNYLNQGIEKFKFKVDDANKQVEPLQKASQVQIITDLNQWVELIKFRNNQFETFLNKIDSQTSDIGQHEVQLAQKYVNFYEELLSDHSETGMQKLLIDLEHALTRLINMLQPNVNKSIDLERDKELPVNEEIQEQELSN